MKKRQVTVDLEYIGSFPKGRADKTRLDATSEDELALQQAADDADARAEVLCSRGNVRGL